MAKKLFKPEEIINKLREAEVLNKTSAQYLTLAASGVE
jgi:hypothetical protein